MSLVRLLTLLGCSLPAFAALEGRARAAAAPPAPSAEGVAFFEKRVRPVLVEHCYRCHSAGAKKARGKLSLDTRAGVLRGGESGPAVVPGEPDRSLLLRAVRHADAALRMPPDKKLPPSAIADLTAWVKMGAPDPRAEGAAPVPEVDLVKAREFWSLRPVRDPAVPGVKDARWVRTPVDAFILARLEKERLKPAAEADRRTLLRRVTFDLTGLPPTPEEAEAFLADKRPDAYERVVDRLLASPAYGERWGRHWLDLVRYADTSGCNSDYPVQEAWRYRNYVVAAFNADKPYDRFLKEQIAGDLLPSSSTGRRHEQVVATGFWAVARRFGSLDDENHLTLEDAIDTLGKAVLGLSLGCARCHDHKYDPVLQRDYYALYGILQSTRFSYPGTEIYRWPRDRVPLVATPAEEEALRAHLDAMVEMDDDIKKKWVRMQGLDSGPEKSKASAAYQAAVKARDEFVKKAPAYAKAYGVFDGKPADARVHLKGDPKALGAEVPRGFLQVLGGQALSKEEKGSGRAQLAGWLADGKNPLTARVFVNRLWQHHMGRGIVATPNDFGARGAAPTHPELLDWLAARFVEGGWHAKPVHRLLVLSATYRMVSEGDEANVRRDPANLLRGRFERRRLSAEEVRDALLALGGNLDRSPGGAHPFPAEAGWRFTQHRPFFAVYETERRGVYLMQQRLKKHPLLEVFDGADPNATTPARGTTTTPLQALFWMNSPFAHAQADRFAGRVLEAPTVRARLDRAHRLALGRAPDDEEVAEAGDYLKRCVERLKAGGVPEEKRERAAWASYLRVLLSGNEFVFVD